jgi:hypothetical protein
MKAPPGIKTPNQYLDSLPADRRQALSKLHAAIKKAAPELKPHIAHGMIGYGPFPYKTGSGCEGDWFVVGLASQKNYISLYLCACDDDGYLAERNKDVLGRVSVGKSCIRFKRLEDLNLKAALQLVKKASRLAQKNGNVSA